MAMGSMQFSGWAPWPPFPLILMEKTSQEALAGPFFEADGAGVIFRRYVKADENVGLYHVQGAFLYHIFGAGAVLLGRLEQENHISCQFVLDFGQHSGAV